MDQQSSGMTPYERVIRATRSQTITELFVRQIDARGNVVWRERAPRVLFDAPARAALTKTLHA